MAELSVIGAMAFWILVGAGAIALGLLATLGALMYLVTAACEALNK